MPANSKRDNLVTDREAMRAVVREEVAALRDELRALAQQTSRARYVTLAQAHHMFGIAPRTLRQHIRAGRLHGYAPGGTKLLIDIAELEQFIRATAVDRDRDIDAIAEQAIAEMEVTRR